MQLIALVESLLDRNPFFLFDLRRSGQDWIRTSEGVSQRIYSPPRLATSVPTREKGGALYARAIGAASD
jgi:hypothetical protein